MKVISFLRGLVGTLLVAVGAQADTIYVPGNCPTIQEAVVAFPKPKNGSGFPARVFAILP